MVSLIGPAFLAFILATLITLVELVSSKYPRTMSMIKSCRCLYVYSLIYGAISLVVMAALDYFIAVGAIQLGEGSFPNRWLQSIAVGFSTKALLHIRVFTVTVGSQAIPVGIETIVQTFEPTLLQCIEIHEFNKVREFLEPRARLYDDLEDVQAKIRSELPPALAEADRKSFELDLKNTKSPMEALELYFRRFGKTSVERVFPLTFQLKSAEASIEITFPVVDVQDEGWVKGTATVPNHCFLWVLVGVEQMQGRWWPQGGRPVTLKEDGTWEVLVYYGQRGEKGKFEILALVVDSGTSKVFEKWYETARGHYFPITLPKPIGDYPSSRLMVEKK